MNTTVTQLQLKTITEDEMQGIYEIIITGLAGIKGQIHTRLGISHYPMERFYIDNIECLTTLLGLVDKEQK